MNRKQIPISKFNSAFFLMSVFTILNLEISTLNVNAENNFQLQEVEMGTSTKNENTGSIDIPSNPFEIVEMIRRANSMNDATNPSDAIDDAIKSFDMINDEKRF